MPKYKKVVRQGRAKVSMMVAARGPGDRSPRTHDCGMSTRTNYSTRNALANLKQAASFEKSCAERVTDLLSVQQSLTEQIQKLEEKEKKGVVLLQEADKIWSSMEERYKQQLEEKKETYKMLQKEKQDLDGNIHKWRKIQKGIEFEIKTLDSTNQDIKMKTIQKENDIKILQMEIERYKKRIANNAKNLENAKNSYKSKKEASEARLGKLNEEIERCRKKIGEECDCRECKDQEGQCYIKEAREDLQKLCRCLLQKRLENEDLRAEKEALLQEITLLKTTSDTCSDRCAKREKNIIEETKRIDDEISDIQLRCIPCNQQTDSAELTGYCIDCPRCRIKRDCLIIDGECFTDRNKECICTQIKEKFLDNVFENMYNVLEKKAKTCPGKEVADCIFTCLERSRNGKLDENTRRIVQDFVLSTVKHNLNITIIGGAVKTRCEMDSEMYRQLMLCLKDVTVQKPIKTDKAIAVRKPPCSRWNESSECNCPQGPKNCICSKKAPKPASEPGSCGVFDDEETEDLEPQPDEESICPSCYEKKVRAAQCMLGPEVLSKVRWVCKHPTPPIVPSTSSLFKKAVRISGNKAKKSCRTDDRSLERSRHEMIEGVMGRYTEITSIEEVTVADHHHCKMCAATGTFSRCDCARLPTQNKKKYR